MVPISGLYRRLALFVLVVMLLPLAGVAAPIHAQDGPALGFEAWDCPFPALDGVTCGYLTVPEDRSQPDGYTIDLAVAIISPWGSDPDPVPVIYLEGGPGGSPLLSTDVFQAEPIAENHTLILFDQRGTGFSLPSLNCPELEGDQGGTDDPVQACRDRLEAEGIDLQMYNSAANAADVYDLVMALGYDQVNLWGISYGTKLGLTILRDTPEIVQSAVLDSVYAPEVDDLSPQSGFMGALYTLFESCAADSACSDLYPDLEGDFYTMLDQLDAAPVTLDLDGEELTLDGAAVYNALFTTLYDTQAIPFLPYGIELLAYPQGEDDYAAGYSILSDADFPIAVSTGPQIDAPIEESDQVQAYIDEAGQIDDSEGMAFSVDCQEEYQLDSPDAALSAAEAAPVPLNAYFLDGINSTLQDCATWGVQDADPIETQRVISDVPTLLFAGGFDPITPASSAESALQGLSNGQLLVFPSAGHGVTFAATDAGACAKSLMIAFLDDPYAPLDTRCIAETSAIDFYTD